jgi:hypothetical protein
MTTSYKILGQASPYIASGTTSSGWTTLYTVPAGTQAIVTNIIASPTTYGEASTHFSISLVPSGGTANNTSTSLGSYYYVNPNGFPPIINDANMNYDLCMSAGDSIQVMYDSYPRAVGDPRYPTTFTVLGTEIT